MSEVNVPEQSVARRRKGPPIWLVIVAVTVGLIATCVGGVAYFFIDAAGETKEVEAVLEDFMTSTSSHDFATAYSFLSNDAKATITQDAFARGVQQNPGFDNFVGLKKTGWRKMVFVGKGTTFFYQGNVQHSTSDHSVLRANLVREEDSWKILYVEVVQVLGK